MGATYDFGGWATKNDIRCSDGRTIRRNAFKHNDGSTVPLVWNHEHNDPGHVLGHALLENRDNGVYAYCSLNDTDGGKQAKELVKHGDVVALSIYANQLRQNGGDVMHGTIREVSLVLAGANPGAYIDTIIEHSDDMDETANIAFIDTDSIEMAHSEKDEHIEEPTTEEVIEHAESKEDEKVADSEKTIKEIFDEMTDEQKNVVYAMIGQAIEDAKDGDSEGGKDVKHNLFESDEMEQDNVLTHSEMMEILADGKRYGSLKEAALQHGVTDIEMLFPDAKNVNSGAPDFINRDQEWVSKVMNGTKHSPFSRIKSIFANITEDEARALGYLPDRTHRDSKGNLVDAEGNRVMKKEEVFSLLKRTTSPATIYKKQRLDRDDVLDITDFDVVSWIKIEMRMMLNEEIARAILVGDGRPNSSDDKINELNIRPIWKDEDLFTVKVPVKVAAGASDDVKAKSAIRAIIKSRKKYKGSGNPTAYITEDLLTDMLLLEDVNGRVIYDTMEKLRTALRVKEIVSVPVMENLSRTGDDGKTYELGCLIVNLSDYNVGADKGGSVTMFDNFDIDYNAQKYLIETRCSGALIKPFSAMAIEFVVAEASDELGE